MKHCIFLSHFFMLTWHGGGTHGCLKTAAMLDKNGKYQRHALMNKSFQLLYLNHFSATWFHHSTILIWCFLLNFSEKCMTHLSDWQGLGRLGEPEKDACFGLPGVVTTAEQKHLKFSFRFLRSKPQRNSHSFGFLLESFKLAHFEG